jgi:PAS domain S-box-containing protein
MSGAEFATLRARPSDAALLALLEVVARTANEADSLEEAGKLALRAVCELTGWPVGHLCLPDPVDPDVFVTSGVWVTRADEDFPTLRRVTAGTRFPPGVGLVGVVAETRAPAWMADVNADPNFVRAHRGEDLGIASAIGLPVPGSQGVTAVLEFFSRRHMPLDPELLRVMGTIGDQLGRVADRVQARREVEASARRLEQIIETSAEAFVAIDADGVITGWNAAAEQMFGRPRDKALGQPLAETIVPPSLRDAHRTGLARFLSTGERRVIGKRIEIVAWRRDIGEFPIELAIWAVREDDRWSFNAFLHDIRDRRIAEAALREAYENERANAARLRSLDQAKDDFVATVSHELRTPLTSLSGYLELMLEGDAGPVSEQQHRMLETMAKNAGRLRALIEDLLLINQMDAGSLQLDLEQTSVGGLVRRAVQSVAALAQARDQRVAIHLDADLGSIRADAAHLERAIRGLVSNAIKFSPDGGAVRVCGRRLAGQVEVAVTDEGVGIDEDDVPRLFDRFFRTSQATTAAVQGAGLGLTISRRIVEEHGGTVEVASKPGKGSTFTVRLPA